MPSHPAPADIAIAPRLLRLSWTNYDGTHLRLLQNKGKKRVTISCSVSRLRPRWMPPRALGGWPQRYRPTRAAGPGPKTVSALHGAKPLQRSGLAADLHFHDLRGTAVTRLALADADRARKSQQSPATA